MIKEPGQSASCNNNRRPCTTEEQTQREIMPIPQIINRYRLTSTYILVSICLCFNTSLYAQNPESLNRSGVEAGSEENYKRAHEKFKQAATQYDRTSARILHNRALAYEKQGNISDAIKAYDEAVRRNPEQYQSLERLGYWKYKRGEYKEAVSLGERALKRDPDNRKVKSWIEDAYRKKIDSISAKSPKRSTEDSAHYYTIKGDHFPPRYDPLDPFRAQVYITFDFLLKFRYQPEESKISHEWTPGHVMNFPYSLDASYRPDSNWALFCSINHPYTGAALPNVSGQSERLEARYYIGNFVLGAGVLLNHYNDSFFNGEELRMMDIKGGGSLHYEKGENTIDAVFYPRLLIPDGPWSKNVTYDTAYNEFKYSFSYSPSLLYYTRLVQADFYFFNHDLEYSDYYGYFDMALGGEVVNHNLFDTVDITFQGEIGKRFNLERTGVDSPYKIFNGQGLLGIDIYRNGGSFFSGQKSTSTLLMLGIRERFTARFFMYQRFYADMSGYGEPVQNYLLQFGLGYVQ